MSHLSEQFHEQYSRFQQQFEQWSPFEQCYASVELSKKLQLSYRYFLSQFLVHVNLKSDSNEMFNHTVHQANTPGNWQTGNGPEFHSSLFRLSAILACLLCDPLDKMISTLQLYLPLLSLATTNEKLLEAYRDVFVHLDGKLANPANFSYPEKQLIQFCQQIRYFIQINPSLQKFLVTVPQLTALALSHASMIHQGITDEVRFVAIILSDRETRFEDNRPALTLESQWRQRFLHSSWTTGCQYSLIAWRQTVSPDF